MQDRAWLGVIYDRRIAIETSGRGWLSSTAATKSQAMSKFKIIKEMLASSTLRLSVRSGGKWSCSLGKAGLTIDDSHGEDSSASAPGLPQL